MSHGHGSHVASSFSLMALTIPLYLENNSCRGIIVTPTILKVE